MVVSYEVSYEERDIIKDSESVEASDGDEQKSLFFLQLLPRPLSNLFLFDRR